jgi:hypothetical protein
MTPRLLNQLLDQVEDLCTLYVGKNAPGEMWGDTCDRLIKLDRVIKRVRRTHPRKEPLPSGRTPQC